MSQALKAQTQREKKVMFYLAYSGLIPFIAAIVMQAAGVQAWGYSGVVIFCTYSAVILSFLSGILWGRSLHADENKLLYLIVSNVFALLAWGSLLNHHHLSTLILLGIGFVLVFSVEMRQPANVVKHYIHMRLMLTVAVVAMHIAMLIVL